MIDFDGIAVGLFEPEFGALMARRAVLTLVDRFVRAGGTYLQGAVQQPHPHPGSTRCAVFRRGRCRRPVRFGLGPWLPSSFPT